MKTPTKRATRRLAASLAIVLAFATGGAWADTYYWKNPASNTSAYATGAWTNATGTAITLTDNSAAATYVNDDFVINAGGVAWSSTSGNDNAHYFNTKSLQLRGEQGKNARFIFRGSALRNCKFELYPYGEISFYGRKENRGSGLMEDSSIKVDSSATREAPAIFVVYKDNSNWNEVNGANVRGPISGDGALVFTYLTIGNTTYQSQMSPATLTANNSGFTGILAVKGYGASNRQVLRVNNANGLAGDPETFQQYGLELEHAKISALVTAATTANRGLYISQNSEIEVESGKTFTVPGAFAFADASKTLTKSGAGTLVLSGGLQDGAACGTMTVSAGTLTLGGGATFNSSKLAFSSSTTLGLDGGATIVADSAGAFLSNGPSISVGAGGGTIDVNSKTITLLRPILEDSESIGGGMAFKGGGVVTLASGNTYTGKTTVELGTTVHVPAQDEIGGGLAVSVPAQAPADGVYTLLVCDGEGVFTDEVLTGVVAPANSRLLVTTGGKSVVCVYGDGGPVWIGGTSGSLSEASNWANNAVPGAGTNCVIGVGGAATLTVGDTFAPLTITFPADTALITISGEGTLSGLTSIVNNSSQHHVIACPVDASAATPTLPLADGNYLVFSGGIALTEMPSVTSMRIAGVWNLAGNWKEPPAGTHIVSGSTVTVSGVLDDGYNIFVQANATLQVARAKANLGADNKNRFLYQNDGTFIVTGEMQDKILSSGDTTYSLAGFFEYGNNNAVTRANGLVHSGSTQGQHQFRLNSKSNSVTNTIVLGSGGLSFRDNLVRNTSCYPYFQIDSGKSAVLASSADWSFGANSVSGKDLCLELGGAVTVDTSDYDDRTVPHTITAIGRIGNHGKVTVTGCGTMAFEHSSDFAGGLDVKDTATVSFNSGCGLGRCGANMASGTTLKVAESGTVTLGGDLTLADGATLAFNFTGKRAAPVLDVTGKNVTAAGTVKVKIAAASGIRPVTAGGKFTLTSGGTFTDGMVSLDETNKPCWAEKVEVENGEIVLYVRPLGTIFFIK